MILAHHDPRLLRNWSSPGGTVGTKEWKRLQESCLERGRAGVTEMGAVTRCLPLNY